MSQPAAHISLVPDEATKKKRTPVGRNNVAGALLLGGIIGVLGIALAVGHGRVGQLAVIDVAVIVILSFIPGWLYVRFIGQRAGAIWDEFVLNLHRLRLDDPAFLPEPPRCSPFYDAWDKGDGGKCDKQQTIYRKKFDAYYGRRVADAGSESRVNIETFFPVVLSTVLIAIGWTAILWGDVLPSGVPEGAYAALAYGFIGAYLFNLQMLGRRFFQRDLKPSAYAGVVVRFVAVAAIVLVLHQLPMFAGDGREAEAVVAFVVGIFPHVGIEAITHFVRKVLGTTVPSLRSDYPLSQLDGLNVWYEARLLEEGIEDMQNLVTANLVDVMLHTRVPVGRLIDWCDQSHLYLRLPPLPPDDAPADVVANHPRAVLRRFGVQNATSYVEIFGVDAAGQPASPVVAEAMKSAAAEAKLPLEALTSVARLLCKDSALRPITAWRAGEGCTAQRELGAAA